MVIWTDADREGENIGFEIIDVCRGVNPRIQVYRSVMLLFILFLKTQFYIILINIGCFRAILSEITRPSVQRAISNLGPPNKNISDAVDVRSELDLRIGY